MADADTHPHASGGEQETMSLPGFKNIADVVNDTGIKDATLRHWCWSGKIPATKVSKTWFIPESVIPTLKISQRGRKPKGATDE